MTATHEADADAVSIAFVGIVCADPDLDFRLEQLLILFAVPAPATVGGYMHHAHAPHRVIL